MMFYGADWAVFLQIGWWGDMGGPKQKGIKTYGALSNRFVPCPHIHPCSRRSLSLPSTTPCRYAPCLHLQRLQANHAPASLRRPPSYFLCVVLLQEQDITFFFIYLNADDRLKSTASTTGPRTSTPTTTLSRVTLTTSLRRVLSSLDSTRGLPLSLWLIRRL